MIDEKIKNYITALNEKAKEIDGEFTSTYDFTQGKTYFKIWQTLSNQQRCIFAFIDQQGNIYKPAGLNAPAKSIRGNLDGFRPLCFAQFYKNKRIV